MSGRKNIYQQYGQMPPAIQGKNIWARHDAFLQTKIDVFCKVCGKLIEMPSAEGPGAYPIYVYEIEMQHQIHQGCARELDQRGINY